MPTPATLTCVQLHWIRHLFATWWTRDQRPDDNRHPSCRSIPKFELNDYSVDDSNACICTACIVPRVLWSTSVCTSQDFCKASRTCTVALAVWKEELFYKKSFYLRHQSKASNLFWTRYLIKMFPNSPGWHRVPSFLFTSTETKYMYMYISSPFKKKK